METNWCAIINLSIILAPVLLVNIVEWLVERIHVLAHRNNWETDTGIVKKIYICLVSPPHE